MKKNKSKFIFSECPAFELKNFGINGEFSIRTAHTVTPAAKAGKSTIDVEAHPRLVLIRGLPGSGKSTLAKAFSTCGYRHYEADMFFVHNQIYSFNPSKSKESHEWCQQLAKRTIGFGRLVVVSNIFCKVSDLFPYLALTDNALVIETCGSWSNVHGVSDAALRKLNTNWESISS